MNSYRPFYFSMLLGSKNYLEQFFYRFTWRGGVKRYHHWNAQLMYSVNAATFLRSTQTFDGYVPIGLMKPGILVNTNANDIFWNLLRCAGTPVMPYPWSLRSYGSAVLAPASAPVIWFLPRLEFALVRPSYGCGYRSQPIPLQPYLGRGIAAKYLDH